MAPEKVKPFRNRVATELGLEPGVLCGRTTLEAVYGLGHGSRRRWSGRGAAAWQIDVWATRCSKRCARTPSSAIFGRSAPASNTAPTRCHIDVLHALDGAHDFVDVVRDSSALPGNRARSRSC